MCDALSADAEIGSTGKYFQTDLVFALALIGSIQPEISYRLNAETRVSELRIPKVRISQMKYLHSADILETVVAMLFQQHLYLPKTMSTIPKPKRI